MSIYTNSSRTNNTKFVPINGQKICEKIVVLANEQIFVHYSNKQVIYEQNSCPKETNIRQKILKTNL